MTPFTAIRTIAIPLFAVCVALSISEIASAQDTASLVAPTITSIGRSTHTPGGIDVLGRSDPRVTINLELIFDESGPIQRSQTSSSEAGEWSITLGDSSFPNGAYTLRAIVQDSKGVLGPSTEVRGYKLEPPPLLSIGGVEFGWLDAFILLFLATFFLLAFASWYYEHHKRLEEERTLIAERDMDGMSHTLLSEVERLDTLIRDSKTMDPHVAAEAEYIIKNQRGTLEKMQGYLSAGIDKLRG